MREKRVQKFCRLFGSSFTFWVIKKFQQENSHQIIFTPSIEYSEKLYNEFSNLLDNSQLAYFPAHQDATYQNVIPIPEIVANRIDCLFKIRQKKPLIIISEITSIVEKIAPLEDLKSIHLKINNEYKRKELLEKLVEFGYLRIGVVEEKGEFSWRGEVLDIFPLHQENAYRINFFDDFIETIKLLDIKTQLSTKVVQKIMILPAKEIIPSKKNIEKALEEFRHNRAKVSASEYQEAIIHLEKGDFLLVGKYFPYFYKKKFSWLEFLEKESSQLIFQKAEQINFFLQNFFVELKQEYQNITLIEKLPNLYDFYKNEKEIKNLLKEYPISEVFEEFTEDALSYNFYDLQNLFSPNDRNWNDKLKKIKNKLKENSKVIFCVQEKKTIPKLTNILRDLDFPLADIYEDATYFFFQALKKNSTLTTSHLQELTILIYPLQSSFFYSKNPSHFQDHHFEYCLISDNDLWPKKNFSHKEKILTDFKTKITQLKINDLVVHIDHGIGKYLGLVNVKNEQQREDFLLLEYKKGSKLYVRADEINYKIQRFSTFDANFPLSELGSKKWQLRKKRVEKGVEKIADGLLQIYVERMNKTRKPYELDNQMKEAFANDFPFIETEDQAQVIEEVFLDLSSNKPMDRLICGDAGFGKTEVAMRAAFQVTMNGFQVIILAPTTILVTQHFYSFQERFKNFPIRVGFLSSFLNKMQVKKTLGDFAERKIEILIGTHILLHKNLVGDSIGLLIIDEEHRFGVKQKEKLREFRSFIDILSMSATPIPRTLNFSLLKIRDISLITTPPKDRKQIKTKVLYYEEKIVKEAIKREVARNGQAFILYNKIASIEVFLKELKAILPDYEIRIAHAKMSKKELEKIMLDFSNNKFPILLTTTIIESGLDIPNANSLLVYNANYFGLSQLYQIRGRVGRSNRQAYVYFFINPNKKISDKAKKRLSILQEIQGTQGYKIANHDMELRGVGNLVGVEQSGHIQTVGYDLFIAMLEEAIEKIRTTEPTGVRNNIQIFSYIKGYIPENYISNMNTRLYTYQMINRCYQEKKILDLKEELTDKFGKIPTEIENLFAMVDLQNFAHKNQIIFIDYKPKSIKLKIVEKVLTKEKILQIAKNSSIKFLINNEILLEKEIPSLNEVKIQIKNILNN